MPAPLPAVRHFFVDEAGDLTLFDKRGNIIIGTPGVSHTFMVGVCELADPERAQAELANLRKSLLADSYFRNVPSMSLAARKTALAFHAKDDIPEVRREVFRVIDTLEPRAFVAIRRKRQLVAAAQAVFRRTGAKLRDHDIYDGLIERACTNLLHKAEETRWTFSRRGKSNRNAALTEALTRAKERFNQKWGTAHDKPAHVVSAAPSEHAGLQIVDYLLWAVQRLVERGEDRYFESMSRHYRLVQDLDDFRTTPYGAWYSKSNPLILEKVMPVAPG